MTRSVEEGSFWDHLEELRGRLISVLGTVAAATALAFAFSRTLMGFVLAGGPEQVQALAPAEALSAHLGLSLLVGLLGASPVVLYQFWRFVSPGLYARERRAAAVAASFCLLLFAAGVVFAWLVMLEPVLGMLRSFEGTGIRGDWSLSNYIGFLGRFLLVFGAAFQLPVVVVLLVRLGIVTPSGLSRYRRHIIVGLLAVAAVITPPDPLTQVMLALPLYLLFELSLQLSRLFAGRRPRPLSSEDA